MSGAYHPVQRLAHWAVAAAVVIAIPLGIGIDEFSDAEVREITGGGLGIGDLYWWHKSFGFLVLFLMILRLIARIVWKTPPYDPPLSPKERLGALVVHKGLYIALLLMPLLGWLGTNWFGPGAATFFGITMPDLVGQDREMSALALAAHGIVAWLLFALVAAHLAALGWHGWVKKDAIIERMVGGGRD